jgi:hypothetical protein
MTQITVNADLARQIESASYPIVFVDESGKPLVQATETTLPPGMTAEYWAELQRRMDTPGTYSTLEQIKKRLGWQDQK